MKFFKFECESLSQRLEHYECLLSSMNNKTIKRLTEKLEYLNLVDDDIDFYIYEETSGRYIGVFRKQRLHFGFVVERPEPFSFIELCERFEVQLPENLAQFKLAIEPILADEEDV